MTPRKVVRAWAWKWVSGRIDPFYVAATRALVRSEYRGCCGDAIKVEIRELPRKAGRSQPKGGGR